MNNLPEVTRAPRISTTRFTQHGLSFGVDFALLDGENHYICACMFKKRERYTYRLVICLFHRRVSDARLYNYVTVSLLTVAS